MQTITGPFASPDKRFALVVSRYNDFVTGKLKAGALAALAAAHVPDDHLTLIEVPGAFEIPSAARAAAATRCFDAIVCLGCLIKGETPHFEYISSAVALGLTQASGATGVPMAFGVLTTNSVEEALARAGEGTSNKGWEAAAAAVEMANVVAAVRALAPDLSGGPAAR